MTSIFYYTARIDFRQCISRFSGDFPLFFARFGPENFPVAPNQHHSFGTCSGEPGNTGLSLLPVVCSHIHSKTACRGASERQWRSVANRPSRQARLSPSAPAKKPAKTLGFRRFPFFMCCIAIWCILVRTPGFLIWFYPSPTVSILSSTQNAPDFGCFRMNSGASLFFLLVFGRKIFDIFFVHSADMVHKSKSLVIPLSRDVSFLT